MLVLNPHPADGTWMMLCTKMGGDYVCPLMYGDAFAMVDAVSEADGDGHPGLCSCQILPYY